MKEKHENSLEAESLENAEQLLADSIKDYYAQNLKSAADKLALAHKIFLAFKNINKVSICLSLTGLIKYLLKTDSYYKSLQLLEDSKFLAESTNDNFTIAVNKFAFGEIYYHENKYNDALFYLSFASNNLNNIPILNVRAFELLTLIYISLQNAKQAYEYLSKAIEYSKLYNLKNYSKKLHELSDNFISLNSSVAYNTIEPVKNNKDSRQNTTLLLALSEIARTVNAEANLDKLLMTIAEQTKLVLNADRCSVFLYDKEKNELWPKVALGLGSEEIRFSADKGFAGAVLKTGETIIIKDAYSDNRFNKDIDKKTGYKTYNLICMPIRNIKFEIIGVFQVLNKLNGDFNSSDEEILFAIGTNAGIAIENNLLFNIQQKMLDEQKKLFEGFIDTLSASIDAKDKITLGHSNRVRLYSELIANKLGLNQDVINIISKAARLHDIGKIGIRDAVLQKKGSLTKEEYEHIKEHVKITYEILCKTNINSSFSEITEIASSHHEKYDGTGYFRGLKGENIPLGGRILAVSDVFDAITSVRHYRDRMPIKDALKIIVDGSDKHFDSKIVSAFLSLPLDMIVDILITEYNLKLNDKDRKTLSPINLKEFFNILNKEKLSSSEEKIINTFDGYYIRQNSKAAI